MLLQEEVSILKHLFFYIYTFLYMYDLAKLCSNKLCKSAFQKYLAKKKNINSIKVVTVHYITE